MYSMTGYGKSSFDNDDYSLEIEIKSVNSRFLDTKFYMPKEFYGLENELRNIIKDSISRAKVEIKVKYINENPPQMILDRKRFNSYLSIYKEAAEIMNYSNDLPLEKILGEKDVIKIPESDLEETSLPDDLKNCLKDALEKHHNMSLQEGKSMGEYILTSLKTCTSALSDIESHIPGHKEQLLSNMQQNIEEILKKKLEDNEIKRLMTEVAIYIDKSDITEEIIRLRDHIGKMNELLLSSNLSKGKRFNFILQEMHREINTIGSKFAVVDTFDSILIIKEEIEKCREIVQNVE